MILPLGLAPAAMGTAVGVLIHSIPSLVAVHVPTWPALHHHRKDRRPDTNDHFTNASDEGQDKIPIYS